MTVSFPDTLLAGGLYESRTCVAEGPHDRDGRRWYGYARVGDRDVHEFGPFDTPGRARGVAKAFLVRRGIMKRGE